MIRRDYALAIAAFPLETPGLERRSDLMICAEYNHQSHPKAIQKCDIGDDIVEIGRLQRVAGKTQDKCFTTMCINVRG